MMRAWRWSASRLPCLRASGRPYDTHSMKHLSVLSDAVHTVHRIWQLVLLQFSVILAAFFGFFLFVGIPIAIAFIIFGFDLTDILRARDVTDILAVFRSSGEMLTKYIGVAIFVMFGLLLYFSFLAGLWIFSFGGTIGTLGEAIRNQDYRFMFRRFVAEGRRRFLSVFAFSNIVGFIFLFFVFFLGIVGDGVDRIIELAQQQEAAFAYFLAVFFRLVLFSAGILLMLLPLAVTFFGFAVMTFKQERAVAAFKETLRYLHDHPGAIGFIGLMLLAYLGMGALVMSIGAAFAVIPLVGTILSIPYQMISQAAHAYVSTLLLAVIFHYYRATDFPSTVPPSVSTPQTDISLEPAAAQGPVQQQTVEPQPSEPETPPQTRQ